MSLYQGTKLKPKELALARAKEQQRINTLAERTAKVFGDFHDGQFNKGGNPLPHKPLPERTTFFRPPMKK